jgi:hypothetical protein
LAAAAVGKNAGADALGLLCALVISRAAPFTPMKWAM